MRCKTWCLDLEENKVAEVYAEQIKDRVLRFGLEHPGSQARSKVFLDQFDLDSK